MFHIFVEEFPFIKRVRFHFGIIIIHILTYINDVYHLRHKRIRHFSHLNRSTVAVVFPFLDEFMYECDKIRNWDSLLFIYCANCCPASAYSQPCESKSLDRRSWWPHFFFVFLIVKWSNATMTKWCKRQHENPSFSDAFYTNQFETTTK